MPGYPLVIANRWGDRAWFVQQSEGPSRWSYRLRSSFWQIAQTEPSPSWVEDLEGGLGLVESSSDLGHYRD
jgi:hypothetical protein